MSQTTLRYKLLSALGAFLLWGGWAFYLNASVQLRTGLISGLAQGTSSFIATFIVVLVVTKIYNALAESSLRRFLAAFITSASVGSCMALIHVLVGTPYVLVTIAPSLCVGFLFALFTTFKLASADSQLAISSD